MTREPSLIPQRPLPSPGSGERACCGRSCGWWRNCDWSRRSWRTEPMRFRYTDRAPLPPQPDRHSPRMVRSKCERNSWMALSACARRRRNSAGLACRVPRLARIRAPRWSLRDADAGSLHAAHRHRRIRRDGTARDQRRLGQFGADRATGRNVRGAATCQRTDGRLTPTSCTICGLKTLRSARTHTGLRRGPARSRSPDRYGSRSGSTGRYTD